MKKALLNNVHQCRIDKGETQQELATAIGVTRQTVISIEKGNYTPSVTLAILLAQHYNTRVESLFFYEK